MHVYHYAPYEPAAFKRLMGRHMTREAEMDRMLHAQLFVDLHAVVKHAVRASVERYSIKDMESYLRREAHRVLSYPDRQGRLQLDPRETTYAPQRSRSWM